VKCIVFEGSSQCVWCLRDAEDHPYRWCRRCQGDGIVPDPLDRESQLAGRPSWAWRQHACGCQGGIVTMGGQALSQDDRNRLESARRG
jgi:hypothetical protein